MPRQFRGDVGAVRRAMQVAGFRSVDRCIFNDNSKAKPSTGIRRIKVWWADDIELAPQSQQRKMARELRAYFGARILTMYFIKGSHWRDAGPALCIKLRDV